MNVLKSLAQFLRWSSRLSAKTTVTKCFPGLIWKGHCVSYDLWYMLLPSSCLVRRFVLSFRRMYFCRLIWSSCYVLVDGFYADMWRTVFVMFSFSCLQDRSVGLWGYLRSLLIEFWWKPTSGNSSAPSYVLLSNWLKFWGDFTAICDSIWLAMCSFELKFVVQGIFAGSIGETCEI